MDIYSKVVVAEVLPTIDLYLRLVYPRGNDPPDYHHLLPLATAFGNSSAATTDRIRFGVSARLFHAQYRSGHFGPKRGVIVHDMISDQYSHH